VSNRLLLERCVEAFCVVLQRHAYPFPRNPCNCTQCPDTSYA
jgi:hypothetical protein